MIKTVRCTVCTASCAGAELVAQGVGREDRKVVVRLPGKRNPNYHGARPVHLITTKIKWTRTSRLSIKNSLSEGTKLRLISATVFDNQDISLYSVYS